MSKQILFGVIGLFIGLIIGFVGANRLNDDAKLSPVVSDSPASAPFGDRQIHSADIKEQTPRGAIADVQKAIDRAKAEPDNAQAQTEAGDMYARIGRLPEAVAFYESASKANPNDFRSSVKLANAYFDAGQFEKAAEFYEKALAINPGDLAARTDLGITFVQRGNPDYDRAIKEFEASLKIDPQHEPTLYNLSIAYFKKGEIEKSQAAMKRIEEANPNSKLLEKLKQNLGSQS